MQHKTSLEQNLQYMAYLREMGLTEDELIDELMTEDADVIDALDGCSVEPDGWCPHGYPSVLLWLGLI